MDAIVIDKTPVGLADVLDYMAAWPDKLMDFLKERLVDDDMNEFVKDFVEFADESDYHGRKIREWVNT